MPDLGERGGGTEAAQEFGDPPQARGPVSGGAGRGHRDVQGPDIWQGFASAVIKAVGLRRGGDLIWGGIGSPLHPQLHSCVGWSQFTPLLVAVEDWEQIRGWEGLQGAQGEVPKGVEGQDGARRAERACGGAMWPWGCWEGQDATPDPQEWHKSLASLAEPHQPRD